MTTFTTFTEPNKITPIQCAPWCTDGDGHVSQFMRGDQVCWGADHPVYLSIEEVHAEPSKELGGRNVYLPHVTPCAWRGFNQLPLVYLHVELPKDETDISAKLTADEARQLAAELVAVADEIEGNEAR